MVLRCNNRKDLKNLIKLIASTNNKKSVSVVSLIMAIYISKKRSLRFLQQNCLNVLFFLAERLKELERLVNNFFKEKDSTARRKYLIQIQRKLVKSQEYGDDKLQLVGNMIDLVRAVWHLYVWSGCLSKNSKQPTKHLLNFFFHVVGWYSHSADWNGCGKPWHRQEWGSPSTLETGSPTRYQL